MNASLIKNFIYTDRKTGRVVLVKRSREFDFQLSSGDFYTDLVMSAAAIPFADGYGQKFSPECGMIRLDEELSDSEHSRLDLLKRKIEVQLLIHTSLLMIEKDIEAAFSEDVLQRAPISAANFKIYWQLMRDERRILLGRVNDFRRRLSEQIEKLDSIAAVNREYQRMILNLNLGVYSPTNRERKGIGVQQDHQI